ncbi:MAG: hypothetical protein H0T20_05395, partial [Actinobacteria bacterium]|nr:hypothetical protein [Actinomycetota bacterium]
MAGFAGLEWTAIVLVMVLAYLLVIVFDVAVSRTGAWPGQGAVRRRTRGRAEETPAAPPAPTELEPRHVRVVPREPDPAAQPVLERVPEPIPGPELEPAPAPEPLTPAAELELEEPLPGPGPEPEPEPEPEP